MKNKDKRDDFTAIVDALYKQVQILSDRVDDAQDELDKSREDTARCELRYTQLVHNYDELNKRYEHVININLKLASEIDALTEKVEAHVKETEDLVVDDLPTSIQQARTN